MNQSVINWAKSAKWANTCTGKTSDSSSKNEKWSWKAINENPLVK